VPAHGSTEQKHPLIRLQIRALENPPSLCKFDACPFGTYRPHASVLPQYGILARMPKNKESEFEKLARLIKEEGEDIRTDVRNQIGDVRLEIGGIRQEMHEGFAAINRRLDEIIQMQLDEHAARIKKLETAVFSK
jgi:hypothetical protein